MSAIANFRKRVEDLKKQEQQEAKLHDKQHAQYLQQQKENPAFPYNPEDWHDQQENWSTISKKSD